MSDFDFLPGPLPIEFRIITVDDATPAWTLQVRRRAGQWPDQDDAWQNVPVEFLTEDDYDKQVEGK